MVKGSLPMKSVCLGTVSLPWSSWSVPGSPGVVPCGVCSEDLGSLFPKRFLCSRLLGCLSYAYNRRFPFHTFSFIFFQVFMTRFPSFTFLTPSPCVGLDLLGSFPGDLLSPSSTSSPAIKTFLSSFVERTLPPSRRGCRVPEDCRATSTSLSGLEFPTTHMVPEVCLSSTEMS